MKKIIILIVALSLIVASAAFATIANTKHNLTVSGGQFTRTTDGTATLCGFCHIPHGGITSIEGLPLWARSMGSATYQVYGGGLGTLTGTPIDQPGAFSKTCLSCHDGTVGIGTIIKNNVPTTYAMQGNVSGGLLVDDSAATAYNPLIGTDLRNDHPVGFRFPAAGYGAGNLPGISLAVTSPGAADAALVGLIGTYPLYQSGGTDRFECSTCHDPHLENSGTTQTKFLRSANATICQDCHDVK